MRAREKWTKKDDYPSPRVIREPIPSSIAKVSLVSKREFELVLSAYFEARGLTREGVPTQQKLIEFGLNHVAQDVGERVPKELLG